MLCVWVWWKYNRELIRRLARTKLRRDRAKSNQKTTTAAKQYMTIVTKVEQTKIVNVIVWEQKKRMHHSFSRFNNLLALFQLYANDEMCELCIYYKCTSEQTRKQNAIFTHPTSRREKKTTTFGVHQKNSLLKWYSPFCLLFLVHYSFVLLSLFRL